MSLTDKQWDAIVMARVNMCEPGEVFSEEEVYKLGEWVKRRIIDNVFIEMIFKGEIAAKIDENGKVMMKNMKKENKDERPRNRP